MGKFILFFSVLIILKTGYSQENKRYKAIYSGITWFDDRGIEVNAHGGNIIKEGDLFYLFGESKGNDLNMFQGFSCYSSKDLYNWKFEKIVLPVQDSGRLGPNRIGERVKVLKNPKTKKYVMFMHTDDLNYKDQCVGYATSDKINGVYTFQGPLLFEEKPIKKWDIGIFQDTDGKGYLITHSGNLFGLSDDYQSVTDQLVKDMTAHCEAPTILKKGDTYFWIGSGLTSWERNDNYYFTSKSLRGPWISKNNFALAGTLTWNSQATYVLPITGSKEITYMFMGDRWSFPRQQSSATYVWQPLIVSEDSISLPDFKESWQINLDTGIWSAVSEKRKSIVNFDSNRIKYKGEWKHSGKVSKSTTKNASFELAFKGRKIALYGFSGPENGYANVVLKNSKGTIVMQSIVDMYCKYSSESLQFISPLLSNENYTLTVSVRGEHGNWYNKKGTKFGSSGNMISVSKIILD
nr:family 43 glycosylhydrolase [uncultured Flavobacterium sp.]